MYAFSVCILKSLLIFNYTLIFSIFLYINLCYLFFISNNLFLKKSYILCNTYYFSFLLLYTYVKLKKTFLFHTKIQLFALTKVHFVIDTVKDRKETFCAQYEK